MTRVLLVDDEKDLTFFVKKNLESKGDYQVRVCNDPRLVVAEVRDFKPHVVVLDMMMPEVSGEDIAADLRESKETERLPIVFLTALVKEGEAGSSGNVIGGQFFVAKPVKIDELIRVIKRAMAQSA